MSQEEKTAQTTTTLEDFRSTVRYHVREAYAAMLIAKDQGQVSEENTTDKVIIIRLRQLYTWVHE